MFPAKERVRPEMAAPRAQDLIFFQCVQKAYYARYELGQDGGDARARHAHAKYENAQIIQPDIENGGEDEKIQRRAAVPDGAEHTRRHII